MEKLIKKYKSGFISANELSDMASKIGFNLLSIQCCFGTSLFKYRNEAGQFLTSN